MKRILMSLFIVLVLCFLPSCSIQGTYISLSPPYQDGSMKMVLDKGGKGYVTSDTSIYCFSYDIIDKGYRTQEIELELDFGKKDSLKSLPTGVLIRNHLLLWDDGDVPTIHFKKTRVQRVHGSLIRETCQ